MYRNQFVALGNFLFLSPQHPLRKRVNFKFSELETEQNQPLKMVEAGGIENPGQGAPGRKT